MYIGWMIAGLPEEGKRIVLALSYTLPFTLAARKVRDIAAPGGLDCLTALKIWDSVPLLPLSFQMTLSNLHMMVSLLHLNRPIVAWCGYIVTRAVHSPRGCQALELSATAVLTRKPPDA